MKNVKGFTLIILMIAAVVILFLIMFAVRNIDQEVEREDVLPSPTISATTKKGEISLTGMVWTSGLMEDEKEILGINSDYQLAKSRISEGWLEKTGGMYLVSLKNLDLKQNLGKCVTVSGKINEGWENLSSNNYEINGKWTYNRSAFVVDVIEVNNIDICVGDYDRITNDKEAFEGLEYKTATGTLEFSKRPAPDISYDLELILGEPFIDDFNASGNPVLTQKLDISPMTSDIYKQIIDNIGKKVEASGCMNWGYAESRYLSVEKIKIL